MLKQLTLENIAIIEQLALMPEKNLVVLTGETGSGKSLLLDAIELLFNKKLKAQNFLNPQQNKARIELTFCLKQHPEKVQISSFLEEQGIELNLEEEELILSREITASSSRIRLNGTLVTQQISEHLAPYLVEIYGQHDLHHLFSASRQRNVIDGLGGQALKQLKEETRATYQYWQKAKKQYQQLLDKQGEREKALDYLSFQLTELEAALPIEPNEDTELQAQKNKLSSIEQYQTALKESLEIINPNNLDTVGIQTLLNTLEKNLNQVAQIDPQQNELLENCQAITAQLDDLKQQLQTQLGTTTNSDNTLEQTLERLDLLSKLKRKYGGSIESILNSYQTVKVEFDQLNTIEENLTQLETQVQLAENQYIESAEKLSQARLTLLPKLEQQVTQHLKDLMLETARFEVAHQRLDTPNETGLDQLEMQFAANLGNTLKPLQHVASGGELARLMLAIQLCATQGSGQMLILDEIDAGLSGQALKALAEKLHALSAQNQVLYVTHHPLMAARAQEHWHLSKTHHSESNRTQVSLNCLKDFDARKQVLAVMTAGQNMDDAASQSFMTQLLNAGVS